MSLGIINTLVKHGALEHKSSGPVRTMSPDEANKIKLHKQRVAKNLRKERIQQALDKGEPLPVFKQGRPRKYTPEEAIEVRKLQNKICWEVYKMRLRDGLTKFSNMSVE